MIYFLGLLYTALGFVAHLFREPMTGHMSRDWQDLSNKYLGVVYVLPLSLIVFNHLEPEIKSTSLRYLVAYVFAFGTFGSGVAAGFWYKPSNYNGEYYNGE